MQNHVSYDAGPSAPGLSAPPSNPDASSSRFQPSANMVGRLEKLAKWRIDQSFIEFPKEACEISGGRATVSRAFLVSCSGGKDGKNQSDPTKSEVLDSGGSAGETSSRRKVCPAQRLQPLTETSNRSSTLLSQTVAVKKMKASGDIARELGLTVREAEFLVGLSHENIIRLEGFVEDLSKDIVWLVFPWEENGTLRDFVASTEWEIPERIHLIFDVSSGVEYLHSRQPPICHGDLKSLNVLVNSKCRAVITDFGSARHLKAEDFNNWTKPARNKPPAALSLEVTFSASTNTITLTGDHYTLRWAAPELLYEEEPGLYSDIWALGWVAYEVMTGFIPFQGVKDMVVITRVIQGDLPSITGDARMSLIQALCSLMLVCWSIDPSKRPTAEDCRKSIDWMPMVIPNPLRTSDTAASGARSPWLLVKLGEMHHQQGDYANASDFFTKAVDGYTHNGDRKGKATALVRLAQVHRRRSEYNEAIPFYSEALAISTELDDKPGRADALWGLADGHRARHNYSQAVTSYLEALKIYTDIGNRPGRANALKGLADMHRLRREYSQAITFYSEVLQISTDLGNRRRRADTLWGLAAVHRSLGEYSKAIAFYSEALQIRTDIGDKHGRASVLKSLAEVHRLQNELSQAITLLSEALQISTDIGDRYGRAFSLLHLADVHRDQEGHSDAIRLYKEAAEAFEEIGNTQNATYISNQVAKLSQLSNRKEAT